MAFEVDFNDLDPSEEIGGKDVVAKGDYHMLIETLDEDGGRNGAMHVDFQVLRGTTPGQETKIFPMDFSKDYGKAQRAKLAAFMVAARLHTDDGRLVTVKLIKEAMAKREGLTINWSEAVDRSVCMRLKLSDDGKYVNLDWDKIWSPDDKRAAHIPLHAKRLEREGIKLPANRPVDGIFAEPKQANGKPDNKQQPAKKPAAAEVSTDDLLEGVI